MEEIIILPGEYQQVEYIESHGEEYINTGVKANSNIKMEVTLINPDMSDGDDHTLCGGGVAWGEQYLQLQCRLNSMCSYGDNWDRVDFHGGNITTICQDKNNFYQDGELLSTFSSQQFNTNYDIHIFCAAQSNVPAEFSSFKVAAFKIYNDNNLVRDFVACVRVTDGEAGLYDLVTETFYVNEGSGAFTYPDTPVDNRLSQNLERIRDAVAGIRETLNMPDASIEELEETVVVPPSGTIDINSNGVIDVTSYEYANVNLDCNPKEKDVTFIDYDGTILHSYTKEEFLSLTDMPVNPEHQGLTAQGWNWTLADAKTYVTTYTKLVIGQMYDTDDGSFRVTVSLNEGRLSPYLGFGCDGNYTIDWGDGSTETGQGISIFTPKFVQHNYTNAGIYTISIQHEGLIRIPGDSYNTYLLNINGYAGYDERNSYYACSILSVQGINELYNNSFNGCKNLETVILQHDCTTSIDRYSFNNCRALKAIVIPNYVPIIRDHALNGCWNLKFISIPRSVSSIEGSILSGYALETLTLPDTITTIPDYSLGYNYSLKNLVIPDTVTSIGNSAFCDNHQLSSLYIPDTVTTIGEGAFGSCSLLKEVHLSNEISILKQSVLNSCSCLIYLKIPKKVNTIENYAIGGITILDFSDAESIPTLGGNWAFGLMRSDSKIIVPDNLYESWIAAPIWSESGIVEHIIKASEWNGGNS